MLEPGEAEPEPKQNRIIYYLIASTRYVLGPGEYLNPHRTADYTNLVYM